MIGGSTKNLDIVIRAKNEASAELKKVEGDLGGFSSGSLLATVGWAALGASVVATGRQMVEAAADSIRGQKLMEATLKSTASASGMTAESINNLASEIAATTNIEDDSVISATNMLLTFTQIGRDVFPLATKAAADMATSMNGGVTPSAEQLRQTSIQLGKALNDPVNGVTALKKVGVSLTETQKDMIEKFVKTNDVASAQKVILGELSTEFGGAAKAMANPMEQARNQFGEVYEAIGKQIIPVLNTLATEAKDKLGVILTWLENDAKGFNFVGKTIWGVIEFFKILGEIVWAVAKTAGDFGAVMIGLAKIMYSFVTDVVHNFGNMGQQLQQVFKAIGQALTGNFSDAANTIKNLFSASFQNTTASAKEFGALNKYIGDESSQAWKKVGNDVKGFMSMDGFPEAKGKVETLTAKIGTGAGGLGEGAKKTGDEMKKLADAQKKYNSEMVEFSEKSNAALDETKNKIVDLTGKLQDLMVGQAKDTLEFKSNLATEYVAQEQKVADLTKQVSAETDALKKAELMNELLREKAAFDSKKTVEIAYQKDVQEARRRASLTDFERQMEDLSIGFTIKNQEFEASKLKIENELSLEIKKYEKIKQIKDVGVKLHQLYLNQHERETVESVNREIERYNALAIAIANAAKGKTSGTLSVGAINQRLADAQAGVKNVDIKINVEGGIMDAKTAEKLGDSIMKSLKLNNAL